MKAVWRDGPVANASPDEVNAVIYAEQPGGNISSRGEPRSPLVSFVVQPSETAVAATRAILPLSFPFKNTLLGSLMSCITITLGQLWEKLRDSHGHWKELLCVRKNKGCLTAIWDVNSHKESCLFEQPHKKKRDHDKRCGSDFSPEVWLWLVYSATVCDKWTMIKHPAKWHI